jgi:hypothetical protein
MSFAVAMSRPLRLISRGLGKHAMPRGAARLELVRAPVDDRPHQPKHAASVPRQRPAI